MPTVHCALALARMPLLNEQQCAHSNGCLWEALTTISNTNKGKAGSAVENEHTLCVLPILSRGRKEPLGHFCACT